MFKGSQKNIERGDCIQIGKNGDEVRNISVVGHFQHGKSEIVDSFLEQVHLVHENGSLIIEEERNEVNQIEKLDRLFERSRFFSVPVWIDVGSKPDSSERRKIDLNIVDTCGHLEFAYDASCDLRLSDGTLVVVDFSEGVRCQTEFIVRKAMEYLVKPVLMITGLDKVLGVMKLEKIYQGLRKIINDLNSIISTYKFVSPENSEFSFSPSKGNVVFGSGLQSWGFSISQFSELYSSKFNSEKDVLLRKFWGDNYFNSKTKKWVSSPSWKRPKRSFCRFCLDPILQIWTLCNNKQKKKKLIRILKEIKVKLSVEELKNEGSVLFELVMKKFLPLRIPLVGMFVHHLPSPIIAQKYRSELFYPRKTDTYYEDISTCDPDGKFVMFVSKHVRISSSDQKNELAAYGRVFSGTLRSSTETPMHSMTQEYEMGRREDLSKKGVIQHIFIPSGNGKFVEFDELACGSTCFITGSICWYISEYATITNNSEDEESCYPMKPIVAGLPRRVIKKIVEPKHPQDLPKMIDSMKLLSKIDKGVECVMNKDTGSHEIRTLGEFHLSKCLEDLTRFSQWCEIVYPEENEITYYETVTDPSSQVCLSKSPNKHNRLFMTATPLTEEYDWDPVDTRKIWCFGPEGVGPNVLVNQTKGYAPSILEEYKESVNAGFQWATKLGVLCSEQMRGIRFNFVDALFGGYSRYINTSTGGQIIPTSRRVVMASQYTAKPTLLEPVYKVEVFVRLEDETWAMDIFEDIGGKVLGVMGRSGSKLGWGILNGYVPVRRSLDFRELFMERYYWIKSENEKKSFPEKNVQMIFDHHETVNGWIDPMNSEHNEQQECYQLIQEIRRRKGLNVELPLLTRLLDKL